MAISASYGLYLVFSLFFGWYRAFLKALSLLLVLWTCITLSNGRLLSPRKRESPKSPVRVLQAQTIIMQSKKTAARNQIWHMELQTQQLHHSDTNLEISLMDYYCPTPNGSITCQNRRTFLGLQCQSHSCLPPIRRPSIILMISLDKMVIHN